MKGLCNPARGRVALDEQFYFSIDGFRSKIRVQGEHMLIGESKFDMERLLHTPDPGINHWFDLVNSIFDGCRINDASLQRIQGELVGDHTITIEFPRYSVRLQSKVCTVRGRTQKLQDTRDKFLKRNWLWLSQLTILT